MGDLPMHTLYTGEIFDNNVAPLFPTIQSTFQHLGVLLLKEFNDAVRKINQKLNVTPATLVKVPFDLRHWQTVAQRSIPMASRTKFRRSDSVAFQGKSEVSNRRSK